MASFRAFRTADWRAQATKLERRFPEEWAPRQEPSDAAGALELLKALKELSDASRPQVVVEGEAREVAYSAPAELPEGESGG